MVSIRPETWENAVYKHHLGSGLAWTQAARWAFMNNLNASDSTVCSVKQVDADTIEIVKRKDQNLGLFYRYFGLA